MWVSAAIGAAWAILSWVMFFELAARIRSLGWSVIELVISNNLAEYGRYALGPFTAPALWRPVLGTFFVFLAERVSPDPLLSFRLVTATTLAAFTWSMYIAGRRIGGWASANVAVILAITMPAIGIVLVPSTIALSHLAMLGVVGPAAALSLPLIQHDEHPSLVRAGLSGVFWGLGVLARPDLIFAVAVFFVAFGFVAWRQRRLGLIGIAALAFIVLWAPYLAWSSAQASKYGLLVHQTVYQFYASQGYTVPPPDLKSANDIEAAGYDYAVKLYGTPEENGGSALRAMARNPAALLARVQVNAAKLADLLAGYGFFSRPATILLLLAPAAWLGALVFGRRARTALFLWAAASFATAGYLLLLHIDVRYLIVSLPFAIILCVYGLATASALAPARGRTAVLALIVAAALAWTPRGWSKITAIYPPTGFDLAPLKVTAQQFISITHPTNDERALMAVIWEYDFPAGTYLGVDAFMFDYFARINLVYGYDPNSSYPIGRLFSFVNCEPTHGIFRPARATALNAPILGEIDAPIIGKYSVVKFATSGKRCGVEP